MIKTFIPKKPENGALNLKLIEEDGFQFVTGFYFMDNVNNAIYVVDLPEKCVYWGETLEDAQEVCDLLSAVRCKEDVCQLLSFLAEKEEVKNFEDIVNFFRYDEQYWGCYHTPVEAGVAMFCDQLKTVNGVNEYLYGRAFFKLADGFMDWNKFFQECKKRYKWFENDNTIYINFKEGVPNV